MKRNKKSVGTNVKSMTATRLNTMLALAVAGLITPHAYGDATWTGAADSNWNNVNNWSAPPTGNLIINNTTNPGIYPVVTTTPTNVTPTDIRIGTGGMDGRVDVLSGTLSTGNGNWLFLGYQGGQATLNVANTGGTGGTLTGLGQGSGSLTAGGANANGNFLLGLDAGTRSVLNINTTGTVSGAGMFLSGAGASTGTVNLDSGNVVLSGELQIGSNFYGNGGTGTFNMSGGTVTADLINLSRGSNNQAAITGTANIAGGTINAKRYLTLGFAGNGLSVATVNNTGGTINVNTNTGGTGLLEMGVYDTTNNTFNANTGSVNLQNNSSIVFGSGGNHGGTSTFNQNGGTVTFYADGGATAGGTGSINLGNGNSNGTYVYNLNGGTLTVPQIRKSGTNANGSFNFNGGTLVAATDSTAFLSGLSNATVQSGGATINTNAHNVTVGQNINGVGNVTKTGAGVLTLSSGQDYTGTTAVYAGNLRLTPGNTYNTSRTTVASGATLSTAGVAGNTTLAGGLTQSNGASVDLRNGVADTLFVGNGLTLGGGSLAFDVGSTADAISLTGGAFSLTGTNNVFLANLGGASAGATYSLLTGATGLTLSNFNLQTTNVAGFAASLSVVGGSTLQLTLGSATAALAAYYNVNGNGAFAPASFSANANGTGAVSAIGAATAVTFSSTPVTNATAKTVTLSADQSVKSIAVSDTAAVTLAGAQTLTISDASGITVNTGAGAFSVNTAGVALDANQTWTNNSANPVKVAAAISGASRSLAFTGPGTFVLTGASTYSGATTVNGGTTLQLGDGTAGRDGSIAGTTGVANDGTLVYNRNGANTAAYLISGTGSVVVSGTGTQTLTAANTYTGGTTVQNGATLQIADTTGTANTGTFNLNGGKLLINTAIANYGYSPTINLGADSTIGNAGTGPINYSGTLEGNNHALTIANTGARIFLNGTLNNVTQFNVQAGALGFDINSALNRGTAPVVVANGAAFWYANSGANPIVNNLTFNGGAGPDNRGALFYEGGGANPPALTGTVTLASGNTSIGLGYANDNIRIDGVISGPGAITQLLGSTILNGANTYTGGTTLTTGKVFANNSSALGTGAVTIANTAGGQLVLGNGVNVANPLAINPAGNGGGVTAQGDVYVADGNSATYSGPITIGGSTATGALFAAGTGSTLNLAGRVTSTVPVTVRTGTVVFSNTAGNSSFALIQGTGNNGTKTIQLGANNALPTGVTVDVGATGVTGTVFDLAGYNQTISGLQNSGGTDAGGIVTNSVAGTVSTLTTTGTGIYSGLIQDGAGTTAVTVAGTAASTLTLSGANTYTGTTTVRGGTLKTSGGATTNVLANAGGLDLQSTGKVVFDYTGGTSPVAQVKAILTAGYPGRFAAGQIRATGLPTGQTIGYGDNGVDSVTLRLTLPGDANLSGNVDFNDFLVLQNNYNKTNTRFDQGNFNYDNVTDFNDFLVLQNNFGKTLNGAAVVISREEIAALAAFAESGGAVVPEPASLAVLGLGAAGLLRRRRAK